MEHTDRNGRPKIVKECSYPLTAQGVVELIITDMAVIGVISEGLELREVAPGITPEEIQAVTEPRLIISKQLKEIESKYPIIGYVDNIGAAIRVEITHPDRKLPNRELCEKIFDRGLNPNTQASDGKKYGLILDQGGWYKSTFTIAPNLYSTDEELDLGVELFEKIVKQASQELR